MRYVKLGWWVCAALITAGVSGCATTQMSLVTTPSNAIVRAKPLGGGEWKQLGETPLTLNGSAFKGPEGLGKGPVLIEFTKDGYTPYRMILTEAAAADISLSLELEQHKEYGSAEKLNSIVDGLFESQSLIRAGRYEDAIAKLRELEHDAPQVATIYELEGGAYYLQKRYRESLDAFNLAVKLNPDNPQTVRMRKLLAAALESSTPREPASTSAKKKGESQ